MRPSIVALVAATALVACTTHHAISVTGVELHRNLPALRARGQAVVYATDLRDGDPHPVYETLRADQAVLAELRPTRIRDLTIGCDDAVPERADPSSPCPLVRLRNQALEIRQYDYVDVGRPLRWTLGSVLIGTLGASLTCKAACDDGSTLDRRSTIVLGVVGVAAAGMVVWALIDCSGRWGSAGCHD
jgi:hypothetical protein